MYSRGKYYVDMQEACERASRSRRSIRYHIEQGHIRIKHLRSRGRGGRKMLLVEEDLMKIFDDYNFCQ